MRSVFPCTLLTIFKYLEEVSQVPWESTYSIDEGRKVLKYRCNFSNRICTLAYIIKYFPEELRMHTFIEYRSRILQL